MLLQFLQGNFDVLAFFRDLLLSLPAFVLALSFHEAAHAFVANRCGDPTARLMGRLTLNPIRHLDPMGLLFMFIAGVGWAKPVPVNPNNFRHGRRDDLFVALAGITMNLLLFVVSFVLMYAVIVMQTAAVRAGAGVWYYLYLFFSHLASINLVLAIFNLLPVPPLDGYHVLNDLILKKSYFAPTQVARFGQAAILILVVTGLWSKAMNFIMDGVYEGMSEAVFALFHAVGLI